MKPNPNGREVVADTSETSEFNLVVPTKALSQDSRGLVHRMTRIRQTRKRNTDANRKWATVQRLKNPENIKSAAIRNWVTIARSNLPDAEKALLSYLLTFNPCYPTYQNTALTLGWTPNKIRRTLKRLVEKGLVTYVRGHGGSYKTGIANEYQIHLEALRR